MQGLSGCGGENFSGGKRFAGGFPMRNGASPHTVSGGPTWEDVFPCSLTVLDLLWGIRSQFEWLDWS